MPASKMKNIIVASVVTGILLLFILLSVMVFQMISIKNERRKIDALEAQIAVLEQEIAQTEDQIVHWTGDFKIEERARELGWIYETDK
ncbi:MAG: septum formation initiator family protein [Clostridia bacterium]|nr:septum formation initiator family protein [Clostridia bacterium]MBQ3496121.1 septum formation initiator family protein [Clostridia bacterium]MBQ6882993.1 septum formation initiator family protein [Clostridia bacterium]